jgi:hypothetical protein
VCFDSVFSAAAPSQEHLPLKEVATPHFKKGRNMENPLSIIQPSEIATQGTAATLKETFSPKENPFDNVIEMAAYNKPMFSEAEAMTGIMFMPFLTWTSLTASYLRFFDVTASDHRA